MSLKSWSCEGCTNICYRLIDGVIEKYCKAIIEGKHITKFVTDEYVDCLTKTADPTATDPIPRLHESYTQKSEE